MRVARTTTATAGGTTATTADTGAGGGTLQGSVGPGFEIHLEGTDGVTPGTYTLVVDDMSASHNFHLSGPGVDVKTEVGVEGEETFTVDLQAGEYTFVCDPHAILDERQLHRRGLSPRSNGRRVSGARLDRPVRDPPGRQLVRPQRVDHVRAALPVADVLDVRSRGPWRGGDVRVHHRELVALVLEEPDLGVRHAQLEPVRRGGVVDPRHVPLGDAVLEDEQPARLVRRVRPRRAPDRQARRVGDYHQTVRSIDSSTSSASQKSAERYFQPASARTQTTTPSSSSAASRRRDVDDRTGRDTSEDGLTLDQRPQAGDGLGVRDEQLPIELVDVEDRRHVAVGQRAQAHHRVTRQRLRGRDDQVGKALAESLAGAHERAAGAEAGDEHVDAVERLCDLRPVPS